MSDKQSARRNDGDTRTDSVSDDDESSVIAKELRAPSITRLGRYRLVREIASGGMATVNLAVAEGLDKLVALKIIHPHLAQEENFVRMFLDEARLASAISHRNVCNVFDFGETDGRYYIAMDYLAGQSLRDVLRRMRKADLQMEPLRVSAYVAYMIAEACEGLHAAHELHGAEGQPLNVVHRDVSPHNLFVTYDGNVSVVDFGIARASDRVQNTATGVLKGKFSYMAPEQMRQLEIDRRADVWALGVVLWESLTLQRLFVRASQADTVMSVMMDRLRPPSEVRADIPKELDNITMHALARNPTQRFSTAREMGRELMRFCRDCGIMVGPIEIEHFLGRLFAKEIEESKALLRKAKQSSSESGLWMDVTPSGFARASLRTGAMERARWSGDRTSGESLGGATHTSSMRDVPRPSQTAPRAEALQTAHPIRAVKVKRYALASLLCLSAVAAGAWLALTPQPIERLASTEPIDVAARPTTGAIARNQAPMPSDVIEAPNAPPPGPAEASAPLLTTTPVPVPAPAVREERRTTASARDAASSARANGGQGRLATRPRGGPLGSNPYAPSSPHYELNTAANGTASAAPEPAAVTPAPAAQVAPEPQHEEEPPPPPPAPPPVAQVVTPPPAAPTPAPAPVPAPAPAPPPRSQSFSAEVAVADLDVEGALGSGIISRMLARVQPSLRACYAEAAKRVGHNDFTALPVSLVIDEIGAVRQIDVGAHPLGALPPCVSSALKRARSERVPDVGTSQVRFRLTFAP